MTNIKSSQISIAIIAVALFFSLIILNEAKVADASAPSGLPANVYTESSVSLGTTATQLAATTTNCSSRVVSTGVSPIMLTFTAANGTTTSGSVGAWQAGSTTVAYDSGLYGCGQLAGYSYTTSNVHVVITQD